MVSNQLCWLNLSLTRTAPVGLKALNNWPTFPQLIVNGELVGGLDIVREMIQTGEFSEVVEGE